MLPASQYQVKNFSVGSEKWDGSIFETSAKVTTALFVILSEAKNLAF